MSTLRAAVAGAVFFLAALLLQGCGGGSENLPLEVCPSFHFRHGHGFVHKAQAGEEPRIRCPTDMVYAGPRLQCGWVGRDCVAFTQADVDPQFCIDRYDLTMYGHSLTRWPAGQLPRLVTPQGVPRNDSSGDTHRSPAWIKKKRRLGEQVLPEIVTGDQLECAAEPYTDLDFRSAKVSNSNLFGLGPDKEGPATLEFVGVSDAHGSKVDLEISAETGDGPVPDIFDPASNGKSSATGLVAVNGSHPVSLRFNFKDHDTGAPKVLEKVFLTLYDISQSGDNGLEVNASGISEYFLSHHSVVEVHRPATSSYTFREASPGRQKHHGGSHPLDIEKANVKELWLDSLSRSAVLVYRGVSSFSLSILASSSSGRAFEFAGFSQLASTRLGRRVDCQNDRGDGGHASAADGAEAKFEGSSVRGVGQAVPFSPTSALVCAAAIAAFGFLLAAVPWLCWGRSASIGRSSAKPSYKAFVCQPDVE